MGDVTALGGVSVLVLVVLFSAGLLLAAQRRRTALFLFMAVLSGTILTRLFKDGVGRLRPPTYHASPDPLLSPYSFPSGHSVMSAVVYLTLALILAAVVRRRRVQVYIVSCASCWSA